MFYIMNASSLFGDASASFAEAVECWNGQDQTILVCRRFAAGDRENPIFVHGAQGGYIPEDAELPYRTEYTEDTGMGHRNIGKTIYVDNVIHVIDGKITMRNTIGIGCKKRRVWVFK